MFDVAFMLYVLNAVHVCIAAVGNGQSLSSRFIKDTDHTLPA